MESDIVLKPDEILKIIHSYANNGGTDEQLANLYEVLSIHAPNIKEKEYISTNIKIHSIIGGQRERNKSVTDNVRAYVEETVGEVSLAQIFSALGITTREDKDVGRHAIKKMVDQGIIRPTGKKAGIYIKIDHSENVIDWRNADDVEYNIKLPLNIHELVKIYPGNIIIVAGASNTGKTSFMLEVIRLNQRHHDTYYFNSEMGAAELKTRIMLFADVLAFDKWKFTAIERSSDFAEKIRPDGLNIIDFMEVYDDFWKIGGWIRDIHAKLKKGIAVIAIQKKASTKKEQQDYARGGELTLEKPRLYLAMDRGKIKIVKAKAWRNHDRNPNGLIRTFKLLSGWKFLPQGEWLSEDEDTKQTKYSKYADYGITGANNDRDFPHED
jgi:hypothetical protein